MAGVEPDVVVLAPAPVLAGDLVVDGEESCQSRPSAGRSRWTIVSRVPCGSRLTTTMTMSLAVGGVRFENTSTFSSSLEWIVTLRSSCSAGCARRISLSRVRYGASVRPSASAASQSRTRIWYFSESRYSSLPGRTATCSNSS